MNCLSMTIQWLKSTNIEALNGTHERGKNQCNLKLSISFIKIVKGNNVGGTELRTLQP